MYYSKYNVDIDDNEKKVIYNLVTGSIVVFDQEKFKALKKLQLDEYFSSEEIEQLKEMWIIHDVADETNYIKEKHEEATNKPCDDFFKLTILTTSNCNARCYYCYENGIKKEDMSLDTAKKIVELIKEHHKNKRIFINWFGGEPLYNAEIISYISNELKNAKRVVINGPMGCFENPNYARGTKAIYDFLVVNDIKTLIGGGDSAASVNKLSSPDKFYHISTGGGATLEYLEGKALPGISVIKEES